MSSGITAGALPLSEFEARVGSSHEPPVFRPGMVPRPGLIAKLKDARDASVVLITAPPGYGKTTLLSEWAGIDERTFVWITLGRAERDSVALLTSIVGALAEVEPAAGEALALLKDPAPHIGAVVPTLAAGLATASARLVLVLDDAHLLDSTESVEVIDAIGESLPSGAQLALACRVAPPIQTGRLRAHRKLFDLEAADMAMTQDEGGELLAEMGLRLDAAELQALMGKTEGWPVALYLAGLSLLERADQPAAIAEFAGDGRIVTEYLRDELLSGLPAEQVSFLTRVSILDRFSGELCDAVLERTGSDRILADLAEKSSLLLPLDRKCDWYRFHGLLADALIRRLRRTEPEAESGLHLRASAWFTERDEPDRAIEHAIAGGDVAKAGELIWDLIPDYTARGRNSTMMGWLARFTEEQVSSFAPLALAAFHSCLAAGQGSLARGWLEAAAHADGGSLSRPAGGPYASHVYAARAQLGIGGIGQMRKDARRAISLEPEHSPWQALNDMLEGIALGLSGDYGRARMALQEGARRGGAVAPLVQVICLAQLAVLALDDGDPARAEILAFQARAQIARSGLDDYPGAALSTAATSLVLAHRGDAGRARSDAGRASQLLGRCVAMPSWFEAEAALLLARAYLRLGDSIEAKPWLEMGTKLIERGLDSPLMRKWLLGARSAAEGLARLEDEERRLTPAELRILQYLPTHFSLREIAEAFVVSPNTVKSQVQGIYRKLGVSSRAEAVLAARAAGLIDEATASTPDAR